MWSAGLLPSASQSESASLVSISLHSSAELPERSPSDDPYCEQLFAGNVADNGRSLALCLVRTFPLEGI